MSNPEGLSPSPFDHLIACGYSTQDHDDEDERSALAFSAVLDRVFERLLARPGDPLWLGIVEVNEPGSSAWMDAFGDAVISLEEAANWWPGTERLSLGDVRVRAIPAEAFGREWARIKELAGEWLYPAFDPFLFSRYPEGDLCRVETVGHEGIACCRLPESDAGTALWLESLGFSKADKLDPAPLGPGKNVLCGVRSRGELVEIFGEESVAWMIADARRRESAS
jgi:hypothetical protein